MKSVLELKSMALEREADCVQLTEERDGLLRKIDDLKASANQLNDRLLYQSVHLSDGTTELHNCQLRLETLEEENRELLLCKEQWGKESRKREESVEEEERAHRLEESSRRSGRKR